MNYLTMVRYLLSYIIYIFGVFFQYNGALFSVVYYFTYRYENMNRKFMMHKRQSKRQACAALDQYNHYQQKRTSFQLNK